jgi:hypothetical protein
MTTDNEDAWLKLDERDAALLARDRRPDLLREVIGATRMVARAVEKQADLFNRIPGTCGPGCGHPEDHMIITPDDCDEVARQFMALTSVMGAKLVSDLLSKVVDGLQHKHKVVKRKSSRVAKKRSSKKRS